MTKFGAVKYTLDSMNELGKELDRTNVISEDFKLTIWNLANNIMYEALDKAKDK